MLHSSFSSKWLNLEYNQLNSEDKECEKLYVGLGPMLQETKHFRPTYKEQQLIQRAKWDDYIAKFGWGTQMIKISEVLHDIIKHGIPDELKGIICNFTN